MTPESGRDPSGEASQSICILLNRLVFWTSEPGLVPLDCLGKRGPETAPSDGSRAFGAMLAPETRMRVEQHIDLSPDVLAGKPVIRGTRISVELILDLLAGGTSEDGILENYPGLAREQIRACVAYAADLVRSEKVYPLAG
jgi:uncharacterized protein (DUF433 family)